MIQRIQSVWLFIATACIFGLFLFPYLRIMDSDGIAKDLKVTGVYQNVGGQVVQTEAFLVLTIATVLVGLLPFVIIFLYKNRKKQVLFAYIAIVLVLAYSYWLGQTAKNTIGNISLGPENYGIGAILPSIALLFIILAIRAIKRDEKLIRSADRLR